MQINIKVSTNWKLVLSFLVEVARHVQSTRNRKFIIFLQYVKKKVLQLLLCCIVMQKIQKFYGGPVMSIVTCFWYFVWSCELYDSWLSSTLKWYQLKEFSAVMLDVELHIDIKWQKFSQTKNLPNKIFPWQIFPQ